ncbi:hypothetical protein OPV22_026779 [Ensete ventricosum]|uniref:Uncharacterized protein n=1 Tax=Ensete ventricosum TaxID=4639 RepID=A0AAV8PTS8_ENSVE|nr:hypothetical protein OPV22_026779 [Ensete ventricosum]
MRKAQIAAAFTTKCCRSPSLSRAKDATKREPRPTFPTTLKETKTKSTNHHASRIKKPQRTRKPTKKSRRKGRTWALRSSFDKARECPTSLRHRAWVLAGSASREPLKEGDAHRPPASLLLLLYQNHRSTLRRSKTYLHASPGINGGRPSRAALLTNPSQLRSLRFLDLHFA